MNIRIEPSWKAALKDEFEKPYFVELTQFVKTSYQTQTVYPPPKLIFAAFDTTPFDQVKVVILGQDPYHGPGQANGLAFSVSDGIGVPPSLQNMYKEIETDLGKKVDRSAGNLERWAKQGVLLLNATLTVVAATPGSHQKRGWEEFTDKAVKALSDQRERLVFLLWGAYAQKKGSVIDVRKHLVLNAAHPSPFSAYSGFFGSKHFSKANNYLIKNGKTPIDW
jgi:uracil-DNA glycosylase